MRDFTTGLFSVYCNYDALDVSTSLISNKIIGLKITIRVGETGAIF